MLKHVFKELYSRFKKSGYRSIRYKLILNYSILISALIVVIGSVNLIITTSIIRNNISYYAQQTINETNDKIDVTLENIESTSRIIITNKKIQEAVLALKNSGTYNHDLLELYNLKENLRTSLEDISAALVNIHSLGIYFDDNKVYYFGKVGDKNVYDMDSVESQFPLLDNPMQKTVWIPTHYLKNNARVFSLERKMVDLKNFSVLGILVLNIDYGYLNHILDEGQLGKSGKIFLLDPSGSVISSKDVESVGQKPSFPFMNRVMAGKEGAFVAKFDGNTMLVAYSTSSYTNWKLVGVVPLSELNSDILMKQGIITLLGLLGLIVSLLLSILFASRITAPINKLMSAMKEVEKGCLEVDFEDNNFLETKELSDGFKMMLKNLRELISKVYEGELRKKEAEFKALQAQINPHFLYNTLETINYMLIIEEKYDISKLVTYLGDILRYNIRKGNDIVSLEEDLEQIERFLYIQKMRFGDKLHYEFAISQETLNCRILKLLIQPLVENSINHGIEKKRGKGLLKISSSFEEGSLLIRIEDNGVGIAQDELRKILEADPGPGAAEKNTRLGVNNVNRRIKMYYGDQYGLKIQSEKGIGTCVDVFLPIIMREQTNDENIDCGR